MSNVSPEILRIRGRERYEAGIRHLHVVATDGREGALPQYKHRALRLLALNEGLNDQRIAMIKAWMGKGSCKTIEEALLRMEQRVEQENAQGRT